MRVESHWASPSVPIYSKDEEDKEQQAGAGAQLCALSSGWRLLKSGSIILSPPPQVSGGSVLLVAHSPTHGLVPICLPVSDAPVPCLVIHLLNHWGPPRLAKDQIPGVVRKAELHWMGLLLPPHLWPALHSLQNPPTSHRHILL